MTRILYIATHPMTFDLLMDGHLSYMRSLGYEVHIASAPGPQLDKVAERDQIASHPIAMRREMSPIRDLVSLIELFILMRAVRPEIVNAGTPKAGLLGIAAARLAGVPVRIYTLRGLRLETLAGYRRWLAVLTERLASGLATQVLSVSRSLRTTYLDLGLTKPDKIDVLGEGSSNGVDVDQYAFSATARRQVRGQLGFADSDLVVGYVGRLVKDKGIDDLVSAYASLEAERNNLKLVLVGMLESGDVLARSTVDFIEGRQNIVLTDYLADPAPYYSAMDVFAFPSRREGMPNAILEAASSERPCVAYDVTGSRDAIKDGITGTLVPGGDVPALAQSLDRYLDDPRLRARHGSAARDHVRSHFEQTRVLELLAERYEELLVERQ